MAMRRLLRFTALVGLWVLGSWSARCASASDLPASVHPPQTLSAYHHTAFGNPPGNGGVGGVIYLAQTRDGFLWMSSSRKGLVRFDGDRFAMFAPAPGETLPDAQLGYMAGAEDGGLWFGSSTGVSLLKNGHLTSFGEKQGYLGTDGWFTRAPDGHIWSNTRKALMKFEAGAWHVVYRSPSDVRMEHSVDADGNVWMLIRGRLNVLPAGSKSLRDLNLDLGLWSLTAGKGDLLYLVGPNNVHFFHREGTTLTEVAKPLDIKGLRLVEAADGAVWIASTADGISFIGRDEMDAAIRDGRAPNAEHFGHADGLTSDFAPSLIADDRGDIWVGTNAGIDRFRPAAFTRVPLPAGINAASSAVDGSGNIWVGSENHQMLLLPPGGPIREVAVPRRYLATFSDPQDGTAWAAGAQGLWQLVPDAPVKVRDFDNATVSGGGVPPCMLRDGQGAFYVCQMGRSGNLMASKGDAWKPVFDHPVGPLVLAQDSAGSVWVGGREPDHVYRVTDGRVAARFGPGNGVALGAIRAIFPEAGGAWLGGDDGLQWFDGTRATAMRFADPDITRPVSGVVVDAAGNLWFQTLDGVWRVPEAEVRRARSDPAHVVSPRRFDEEDGIVGPPLLDWTHPSLRLDPSGRLWVQSKDGLSWIDPSRVPAPGVAPTVTLDGFLADDEPVAPGKAGIQLRPAQRTVRIRYTAPAIDRADRITFRYRLSGSGEGWQEAGARREATYTSLPPGHYRFEVVAVGASGAQSPVPATVSFERVPAYFETWWFKALWAVPVGLLLWGAYVARTRTLARRLRIRADEREAVARHVHDTLLQRMQSLSMTLDRLSGDASIPEATRGVIAAATLESQSAVVEGRDQIAALRSNQDAGLALYDRVLAEGAQLQRRTGVAFAFEALGQPRPLKDDAAAEIRDIAFEAMRNAFHHAGASTVTVTVNYEERTFWVIVADDGRGMEAGVSGVAQAGHFGMAGMRERAAGLRARLVIESAPGEGTEVHLATPARIAYSAR